jgi:hypothetical protein
LIDIIIKYWVEILLTSVTSGIIYMLKQYIGLKNGMKALLRNEIVRIYELYTKLSYCPSYMKENIKEMYDNYHKLGGNGMITIMVNKLYDLPNNKR